MLFGSPRSASHEVDSPDKLEWVTERPVSDSPEAPKYGPTVSTLIPIFSRLPCGGRSLLRPSRRATLPIDMGTERPFRWRLGSARKPQSLSLPRFNGHWSAIKIGRAHV